MKVASHCCWCPLPRMPSPAISKAISSICSCWHCDYLHWQLKPLAPNRASDAILMTLCPPSKAVYCQSVSSWSLGDVPVERSTRPARAVTQGTTSGVGARLTYCCACVALLKWERIAFSHHLAVLSYIIINAILPCIWNVSAILSEKRIFSPFVLGIGLGTIWVTDPVFFSELPFPPLSTGASYWNKLVGWSCVFRQNFLVGTSSP